MPNNTCCYFLSILLFSHQADHTQATDMSLLLIITIILAIGFDFINGFHDAANSIATIVSTKVLTPFQAVIWAAFFNFLAYFIFRDHEVANTVAKTVVSGTYDLTVVLSGVIASIIWN